MRVTPEGARVVLLALVAGCAVAARDEAPHLASQPWPGSGGAPAAAGTLPAAVGAPPPPEELVLKAAYPIEAEGDFQPSGLTVQSGRLLTVSDKHDAAIYALDIEGSLARARPYVEFAPPEGEPGPFDFEGLTATEGGGWLLVSESRFRGLRVEGAGAESGGVRRARASWFTPSLLALGLESGCFEVRNAGLEGIAELPGGGVLLAIERQPRGLIELQLDRTLESARVSRLPDSVYPVRPSRGTDFTDLTRVGDAVYALVRNAHLIVRLERAGAVEPSASGHEPIPGSPMAASAAGWREGRAVGYGRTENDPRYTYEDETYGMGEGLAITSSEIFIVLDNNGQARAVDGSDHRALLFVFERPAQL